MQDVVCPVHKKKLIMGQEVLKIGDESVWVLIGKCPVCGVIYIGKKIQIGKKRFVCEFNYEGKKYKYIQQMREMEFSVNADADFNESVQWKGRRKKPLEVMCSSGVEHSSEDDGKEKSFIREIPAKKVAKTEVAAVSANVSGMEILIRIVKSTERGQLYRLEKDEWYIRTTELLGREILGRIAHKELAEFSTQKGAVKINKYKIWPGEEYNLYGFRRFCDVDDLQTISIMNQKNLSAMNTEFEMVTALVYCAGRELPVYIDVYYSKLSGTYFINSESYEIYTKRYGLPYLRIALYDADESFDYENLRQNSELNLYGYSVSKEVGLTTENRQRLLQQLLDNHLMTKSHILNHLEWLLNTHKHQENMRDACECWKEDILFVHRCQICNQRMIWGKFKYRGTTLK